MTRESRASPVSSCTLPDKPAAAVTLLLSSGRSPLRRRHVERGHQPGAGLRDTELDTHREQALCMHGW